VGEAGTVAGDAPRTVYRLRVVLSGITPDDLAAAGGRRYLVPSATPRGAAGLVRPERRALAPLHRARAGVWLRGSGIGQPVHGLASPNLVCGKASGSPTPTTSSLRWGAGVTTCALRPSPHRGPGVVTHGAAAEPGVRPGRALSTCRASGRRWTRGTWAGQPGRSPERCSGGCRGHARDLVPGGESGAHLAPVFRGAVSR
jgi:hypothetical protein